MPQNSQPCTWSIIEAIAGIAPSSIKFFRRLLIVSVVHGVFAASMAQCASHASVMCLFACFSFLAFVVLPVHVP